MGTKILPHKNFSRINQYFGKTRKKKFSKIYKRKPKDKLRQAFVTQILKISIKLQSQLSTKAEKTCFS